MATQAIDHGFVRTVARPAATSTARRWTARVITAVPVLFLLMDIGLKFAVPQPVVVAMTQLGWPVAMSQPLGVLLLACLTLYLFPRTAVLGAVLLTGYFGGAVATHVRVGDPLFSHVLFPTYLGLLLWGGLYLRDDRLRALIPFRSDR